MESIIKKAIEGGWKPTQIGNFQFPCAESNVLDPLFWQALFRNKTEALIPRQKFFSLLFGDEGGDEGWEVAVKWLQENI